MPSSAGSPPDPRFCTVCGGELGAGARFCHRCGAQVGSQPGAPSKGRGLSKALPWSVLALAIVAVVALVFAQRDLRPASPAAGASPLGAGAMRAPDISSMSPEERADRLFDRVMRLASEGKADSAVFFSTMALGALDALAPHDAHRRYDIGVVALVAGRADVAAAQADTILTQRPTHLLGLTLAARVADARGDAVARREFQRRMVAVEQTELAAGLPEYGDHHADILEALRTARSP
ncbi:hypothetical protein BH23GEM1_BH23GEM1_06680 [soil metagenome]